MLVLIGVMSLSTGRAHAQNADSNRLEIVAADGRAVQNTVAGDVAERADTGHAHGGGASYRLGSGDKIKVTVFGEDDLSGVYLVNEDGFISFPLIEEVPVKDRNVVEVRKILSDKLSDGYLVAPSIAIEIAEFRPVYVMGEVRIPGRYAFTADMSVRNVVAVAGGFTYRAAENDVTVTRQSADGQEVRMRLDMDERLQPGDVIVVRERFF